jgi:hypothetical protein
MGDEWDPVGKATFNDCSNLRGRSWKDHGAGPEIFRCNAVIDRGKSLSVLEISVTDNPANFGFELGL